MQFRATSLFGWGRWDILQYRHNERDGVSNHQVHDYFLSRLFRHRWKKTSKLCVTGLCEGNSPVTGEFLGQRASSAENVSIWWRDHGMLHAGYPSVYMSKYALYRWTRQRIHNALIMVGRYLRPMRDKTIQDEAPRIWTRFIPHSPIRRRFRSTASRCSGFL